MGYMQHPLPVVSSFYNNCQTPEKKKILALPVIEFQGLHNNIE
jgi:hypothetical protein